MMTTLRVPVLWLLLALIAVSRVPFYKHWSSEFQLVKLFVASMLFMLLTLFIEAVCVRFVTAVLGLEWHLLGARLYYFFGQVEPSRLTLNWEEENGTASPCEILLVLFLLVSGLLVGSLHWSFIVGCGH